MSITKKSAPKVSKEVQDKLATFETMSAQIRFLASQGFDRGGISRILSAFHGKEVRYQWVRNVLITPVKKA